MKRGFRAWLLAGASSLALGADDPCGGMRFIDVASSAGITFIHDRGGAGYYHLPETMGSGAAWLDADRDGWLDLYVVQSGPFPPNGSAAAANRLWRNRGDGTFEDVTEASGAGHRGYGQGVVAADVDGDADVDLYVTNFGLNALLLNDGAGRFRDGTAAAGVGLDGWSSSAAFADADQDSDLDLYVTRYLEYAPAPDFFCVDRVTGGRRYCDPTLYEGAYDRFYRNRGDGTFEDTTAEAGLDDARGKGLGVLFTDLDHDGHPDIYVANDTTINLLFRNRGDGTFQDLSLMSGAAVNAQGKAQAGMGLAAGDVDGDLDPDLMVTNFDVELNSLFLNHGNMAFEDASASSGFGPPSFNLLGFGVIAADLDLDGDLDAYVTNGHIFEHPYRDTVDYRQPGLLLLGDGAGRFRAVECGPAFAAREVGRGLAAADYDNDGDLDLAVVNSGGPLQLLRNEGLERTWLGVVLEGLAPNTEAVGASVRIDKPSAQVRAVTAGDSYQSSSDKRLLFGLGARESGEVVVEVTWPSGRTARFELAAGRYWVLPESGAAPKDVGYDGGSEGPAGSKIGLVAGLALAGFGLLGWLAFRAAKARHTA